MLKQKMARVQALLRSHHLDLLILGNFGHTVSDDILRYILSCQTEHAILFIPKKGAATLYAIPFEVAQIQHRHPSLRVRPLNESLETMVSAHAKNGIRLGIHASALPYDAGSRLKKIKGVTIHALRDTETLRSKKFPEEIALLRIAARITDRVFWHAIRHWPSFKTEKDAAQYIHGDMIAMGVAPSFPAIIASGKNAAHPHHTPTDRRLQKGFCVIDMGVVYDGYCSDMTRTIFIGRPTAREQALYHTVLRAQEKTIARAVIGARTNDIDAYCRELLGNALEKEFIHGLGHGVGTQVHEWPFVNRTSQTLLEKNMVITIEPGVYRAGAYGIRIEDDIMITKKEPEILTKTKKKLIIV